MDSESPPNNEDRNSDVAKPAANPGLDLAQRYGADMLSGGPKARKNYRKITTFNGFWWYCDLASGKNIRLEPLFIKSGWKVATMGKQLGLGVRTFSRIIEESIGVSGKYWLQQVRMVAACHLLREGGKIECLAKYLGFNRHAEFTREFKKQVGVLPSEFIHAERLRTMPPD